VEALKKAAAASWLEKLQRRNREQAEAQLRLNAARTAAKASAELAAEEGS